MRWINGGEIFELARKSRLNYVEGGCDFKRLKVRAPGRYKGRDNDEGARKRKGYWPSHA
jgi:hypothetical protein